MSEKSQLFSRIALDMSDPEQVLKVIENRKRRARPELEANFVEPSDPIHQQLAEIWIEVLGIEQIGIHDNFFKLGGHSLLVTQVISRLRDLFRVELPLRSFFESPTVAGLAARIETMMAGEQGLVLPPIERVERVGHLPLSFAQERLWFLDQFEPTRAVYNIPHSFQLSGTLEVPLLERAFNAVLSRHESLRTFFANSQDGPVQVISPATELSIPVEDLQSLSEAERETAVSRIASEEAQTSFDLSRGPLIRVRLVRFSSEEHLLLLTLHHIVCDGWSIAVLMRELVTLYQSYSNGAAAALPELPIQYADYAAWQRQWLQGAVLEQQLDYWKQQLAGAPAVLSLPADRPRPARQTFKGGRVRQSMSQELSEQLQQLSRRHGVTLFMTLLAAFQLLLARYSGQEDVVVGTPVANRTRSELEGLIGFFANTLVMRTELSGNPSFAELLERVREVCLEAYQHQDLPFEKLVEELKPERSLSHSPIFQVMFILQNNQATGFEQRLPNLQFKSQGVETEAAKFDLTLSVGKSEAGLSCSLEYNTDLFNVETAQRLVRHCINVLQAVSANPAQPISEVPLLSAEEQQQLVSEWNETAVEYAREKRVHELIAEQSALRPQAVAVVCKDERLSYAELNGRANQLARYLQRLGVGAETVVGICMERSVEMMVGLLAVLKADAAYLPLDPDYPAKRLEFMIADSQAPVLLTQARLQSRLTVPEQTRVVKIDHDWAEIAAESAAEVRTESEAGNLAYVIYTSGSTGQPKGVMISHGNVMNFVTGMDAVLGQDPGVWLAVTSISFDISVLELLWTLARGYEVVIATDQTKVTPTLRSANPAANREMEFSLFYFASDAGVSDLDRYKLLIEGVKFADQNGFTAVWTPERHFHEFGGSYPNPSVTNAALALITERIQLRAGSVVSPLHNPIRIAEEWSMVDNFSKGRVGISFASGWHADDFVFAPDNYKPRREVMRRDIDIVRRLWRGESHKVRGGGGNEIEVKLLPRPTQPELPVWVTAAGSPDTYRLAGEIGAGLLTHLLGQTIEEVGQSVQIYRDAWRKGGHGPGDGHVTVMLHTFIGSDLEEVREKVRKPLTNYLASSLGLIRNLAKSLGMNPDEAGFTEEDKQSLLEHAFDRYFETSGLLGTPEKCLAIIDQLKAIGVDEVACLIDFGVDFNSAMDSLGYLNKVRHLSNSKQESDYSIPALIERHGVTHLQCTPSLATVVAADGDSVRTLSSLDTLLLGGEALPPTLAQQLSAASPGSILNMYGPTETTVWSSMYRLSGALGTIPIGSPIANTQLYVLDQHMSPVPVNVAGELYIGGEGVVRGYQQRPELTASRFIPDPFSRRPGARLYRTGDVARFRADGLVEYLGRADHQLKLRGYRIELGEIEAVLGTHAAVQECVVVAQGEADDVRLMAYVVMRSGQSLNESELRQHARERLPQYMVPSVFLVIDRMPLTANGKVNRRALPEVEASRTGLGREYKAPRTATEETLISIWKQVLKVERVGIHDNFFELGGHSLMAARVVARVRESFSVELPLRSLFESPTVAGLAPQMETMLVGERGLTLPPIARVERKGELPLSYAQQRLWFLDQLESNTSLHNERAAYRLKGQLNVEALKYSINEVLLRHASLRTYFVTSDDGSPAQRILPSAPLNLPQRDLRHLPEPEREIEMRRVMAEEGQKPFQLSCAPLFRCLLLRTAEEEHIFILTIHHIITDGWSMTVFLTELALSYESYLEQRPASLPELPVQYADFAVWQRNWLRGEVFDRLLDYWQQQLKGAPARLLLPADKPRPAIQTYRGASQFASLSPELAQSLRELSRREEATLYMTLLACLNTLLHYYTGESDIVVGTDVANRNSGETELLIGFFVNELVMRTDLTGNPTFRELMGRVREVTLGAYGHQDMPFDRLVDALKIERSPAHHPLFQVSFVYQNAPRATVDVKSLTISMLPVEYTVAHFDLVLRAWESGQVMQLMLEYNSDLFMQATITRLLDLFETLAGIVVQQPEAHLDTLVEMLTQADRARLSDKGKALEEAGSRSLKKAKRRAVATQ